jgi:hypothetical protein
LHMAIRTNKPLRYCPLLVALLCTFVIGASAQFSSGSTGADGPLDYANLPANTTVIFDPGKFSPSLHPAGLYAYNFTTINIPVGVTVVLSGQLIKGPVFWLAQGDVNINGTIQLSGQTGAPATLDTSLRVPALGGPGGFVGGTGGDPAIPAQPGDGPLGGGAGASGRFGGGGGFSGNVLFAPPIGGSGGGGGFCNTAIGPGGGAGGGALVIASSTTISVNGTIDARGGIGPISCANAGGGAGGGVKLVANRITGTTTGNIFALGGSGSPNSGSPGAIRLEGFQISTPFNTDIQATQAAPGALFIPNQAVSIQVLSVGGIPLPGEPSGTFTSPDVVINTGSPVPVAIQTSGIPPGTVLTLHIYSEDGTTQTVQTNALQGTLQSATATANVTFPPDLSLGYLSASWTQ